MQRYFIAPEQFLETAVIVTGDDAHHLMRVMRADIGDPFICSNGLDREVLATISEMLKDRVIGSITRELILDHEPGINVWIAQSLPKGDKLEAVIQKCTEIGATRFIPFISERTVVQYDDRKEAKRLERWQKIAKEAAEQAHRNRIPKVESPITWKQLLLMISETDAAWICYEKETGLPIREALNNKVGRGSNNGKPLQVMLIIGPEGGFSEAEVIAAEAAGSMSISLGARILRTETAAMVGLTCILYENGEMGGRLP